MIKLYICILVICAVPLYAATYSVQASKLNSNLPILNSQDGSSVFKYNYNAAYLPLFIESGELQDALLVRCQNLTDPSNPYSVGQSKLAVSIFTDPIDYEHIVNTAIETSDIVIQPESSADSYGTEDPRIVYREKDQTYYLLYSAVQAHPLIYKLALATTKTPLNASSWIRHGPILPDIELSKSGSLLIRDNYTGPHYLFWGDSTLSVATSYDLLTWNNTPGVWFDTRNDFFDSQLVEAGPMPLQLSDGNYLFIYNSARYGYPSQKPGWDTQYNVGWAILDEKDPTNVLQRSSEPILSPTFGWENGTAPWLGLTPNVVFLEGWKPLPDKPNTFFAVYGAADSCLGTALISVEISP